MEYFNTANLAAFVAVAEHQSFSQAAQALFLTQPAISKRVALLEQALGTALFDRVGRQVHTTEAGALLLPRARRILADMQDCQTAITNLGGQIGGRLSLGASHHIGLHYLPPILQDFTQRHPQVELDLHFLDSEEICRVVAAGELELGIVTLPPNPVAGLRTEPVWDDALHIVVAKNHPLAMHTPWSFGLLESVPAILPSRGTYTRALIDRALADHGVSPHSPLSTNHLEILKMLVAIGLGWSVLPATLIDDQLDILARASFRLSRPLGIVTHAQRTQTLAAQSLARTIRRPG